MGYPIQCELLMLFQFGAISSRICLVWISPYTRRIKNGSRFNNQGILVKDVYKQLKCSYTYKVNIKFLRRSNEMIRIVKLMSLLATTKVKMKITHSTSSEWIA